MILLGGYILGQLWAINPAFVHSNMSVIIKATDGTLSEKDFSQNRAELKPFAIGVIGAGPGRSSINEAKPGSIAVINLSGPLMKRDQFCGPEGTATVGRHIQEADRNPNISAIILQVDSPGGTVDGTETLANIIKNTQKPVIGYVDGMAASAAMWIVSSCDEVIASGNTDMIGSIGTMISFADMKPAFEKAGIKFHEIMASDSFNKNVELMEALKGNYKPMQDNILNPTNKVFTNAIRVNREGKLDKENEEVLTGKIYTSKQALKVGLIDSIGDFDFAVKRASELAKTNATNSQPDMKINIKSTWTALLSLVGIKAADNANDVQHDLTEAQLAEIDSKIAENGTLTGQVAQLTKEKNDALAEVGTLKNQVTGLEAKVKELEENPVGGAGSATIKTGEEAQNGGTKKELSSWEKRAAQQHEI